MKKRYLVSIIIITIISEIFVSIKYVNNKNSYKNDVVKINELSKTIENNFYDKSKYPNTFNYSIINDKEIIIYKSDISSVNSLVEAYKNKNTIVDINVNGNIYKILIDNNIENIMNNNKSIYLKTMFVVSAIQLLSFIIYYIYLYINIIKPFNKMKEFATRVSSGNLDIPLNMDKNNNFGAFTESFDIMRHEIKIARKKEKEAIDAKKELVAKLSHDIKSPVASIKSSSELGLEIAPNERIKNQFSSINKKSDQINTLVTNLFNSTLKEMDELKINPTIISSNIIKELLINSDYLNKANDINIEKCNIYADRLRLQQVFDNIFINSYKYANTKIEIKNYVDDEFFIISIKDFGNSIQDEEMPLLLEKFKRGSNTLNKEGAGLGLYISKEFINQMNGDLEIVNENPGFKVIIKLRII